MGEVEKIKSYSFPPMLGHIDEVAEGSPEWAERLGLRIKLAVEHTERFGVDELLIEIKRALTAKIAPWTVWPEDKPCAQATRYFEYVSGTSIEKITALVNASKDDETLTLWRQATTAKPGGDRQSEKAKESITYNISNGHPAHGTAKAYTLDRLERERPDLYKRVIAKEISVNAAAREAGWRKQATPLNQLRSWWTKASAEERQAFLKEINS